MQGGGIEREREKKKTDRKYSYMMDKR